MTEFFTQKILLEITIRLSKTIGHNLKTKHLYILNHKQATEKYRALYLQGQHCKHTGSQTKGLNVEAVYFLTVLFIRFHLNSKSFLLFKAMEVKGVRDPVSKSKERETEEDALHRVWEDPPVCKKLHLG